jgi:hypothetical protein
MSDYVKARLIRMAFFDDADDDTTPPPNTMNRPDDVLPSQLGNATAINGTEMTTLPPPLQQQLAQAQQNVTAAANHVVNKVTELLQQQQSSATQGDTSPPARDQGGILAKQQPLDTTSPSVTWVIGDGAFWAVAATVIACCCIMGLIFVRCWCLGRNSATTIACAGRPSARPVEIEMGGLNDSGHTANNAINQDMNEE